MVMLGVSGAAHAENLLDIYQQAQIKDTQLLESKAKRDQAFEKINESRAALLPQINLGAGLNYTTFFSEDTKGALAGTDLKLDDSWGLAAHVGMDIKVSERGAVRMDARWIDIDSDVKVDGAKLGTANIDPLVYGVAYVVKF